MIKVVLIDIDNTILSFSGYVKESMREGFSFFGLKPYTEEMFPVFEEINDFLWKQIEQGTLTLEELMEVRWNMIFEQIGIDFDGRLFEKYFREKLFYSAVPEDGAVDILKYLSSKYTLCVASNGPYEQQMNRLRIAGMRDYFKHFFISSQVGAQKPSKQFFDYCINTLKKAEFPELEPDEVIIIGDSVSSDMSGGIEYGIRTCLYQKNSLTERRNPGVDHVISSLAEIKNIL